MHPRLLHGSFAVLVLASAASAQDAIVPERPGVMFSPTVVSEGRLQIETGLLTLTRFRGNGTDADLWNVPVQLRYGLTREVELRLGGTLWNHLHDNMTGEDADGVGDVEIGTKVAISEGESGPRSAVNLGVRLPVGDEEFTAHQLGYSLNLAATWNLGEHDALTSLAGITRTPAGDENALTGSLGLSVAHSFNDTPFSAYVEAAWFPDIDNSVDTAVAGLGVTWLVDNDLQLDAFGDFGLNDDTPDAQVGIGVSLRL
jgi:hypothetical protein